MIPLALLGLASYHSTPPDPRPQELRHHSNNGNNQPLGLNVAREYSGNFPQPLLGLTRGMSSAPGRSPMNSNAYAVRQPSTTHGLSRLRGHPITQPGNDFRDQSVQEVLHRYPNDIPLRGYTEGSRWANNKWAKGHSSDLFLGEVYVMPAKDAETGLHVNRRGDLMGPNHDEKVFYKPGVLSTVAAYAEDVSVPVIVRDKTKVRFNTDPLIPPVWYDHQEYPVSE